MYKDFDINSHQYKSRYEFNWQDQGYYILHNICPEKIDVIHKELEYIISLTSDTFLGYEKKIETKNFREAVQSYIEIILGFYNEEYDYSKINKFIKVIDYKKFIKNVTCYPWKIKKDDYITLRGFFSFEEVFHLLYLTASVKFKTQMTYISKCFEEIIKGMD